MRGYKFYELSRVKTYTIIIIGVTNNIYNLILFTLFAICGGLIITSVSVILNSLSFWFQKSDIIAETGNNLIVNFATYPDSIFKGATKLLLYTIVPVGFSTYIPARILTEFNIHLLLVVLIVTILFILLAFKTFYTGLKKYSSSNLMIAKI